MQDLRDERGRLPKFIPTDAGAVDVAQRAVDLATKQKTDECDAKRGGRGIRHDREEDERKAMDKLSAARADKALTDRDAELASKLGKAQEKVDQIDMSAEIADADPMSSDIAAALDANPVRVAFWIHVLIAIAIEAVSCFGMHLCFHLGNHEQVYNPRKTARRDDRTAEMIADAEVLDDPAVVIGSPPADDVGRAVLQGDRQPRCWPAREGIGHARRLRRLVSAPGLAVDDISGLRQQPALD